MISCRYCRYGCPKVGGSQHVARMARIGLPPIYVLVDCELKP